jgi:hypothetical protein
MIDDASRICGFDFDGTYTSQFSDFAITRISATQQIGSQYWGVLVNNIYTPTGGCQYITAPGDETLWAFDAFNKNYFLSIAPKTATLAPGQSITVAVGQADGNGNFGPAAGASIFGGQIADPSGNAVYTVPAGTAPGTYRFKATRADAIRSNAVIITVTSSSSS